MANLLLNFVVLVSLFASQTLARDNGLALTPPMGWLSWVRFACNIDCKTYPDACINEDLYKAMGDRLVHDGWRELNYVYVNIDDCWSEKERDPQTGRLVADRQRFPSGIKALADWMHERGLKLGIYGDVGYKTCAGYPASNGNGSGYYDLDAQTFAEWGVDSLKFDGCNEDPKNFDTLYPRMGDALNKTNAPIIYSCEWPVYQYGQKINPNYKAISQTCNLFRNDHDIADSFDSLASIIDFYGDNIDSFIPYSGPGSWFDPDMLIIGGYGLSRDQSKAQMAFWAIFSAPLYMSNDLRLIHEEDRKILRNKRIIAVNQDKLGIMGRRVYKENSIEVWVKPILPIVNNTHSFAIVYWNRNGIGYTQLVSQKLSSIIGNVTDKGTYLVQDLYYDRLWKIGYNDELVLPVNPSGGVAMVVVQPVN